MNLDSRSALERAYWAEQGARGQDDAAFHGFNAADGLAECLGYVIEGLAPVLIDYAAILDIGCGPGRLLRPLARAYPRIEWTGLDIATEMTPVDNEFDNASYRIGDGRTIPRVPAVYELGDKWDGAYCVLLFQHLPPDAIESYLASLAKFMRPGGSVVVQFDYHRDVTGTDQEGLIVPTHQAGPFSFSYTADWIVDRFDGAGFDVIDVEQSRLHGGWKWITAERRP